jgi:N-acetyl-gamma-glutamyl-phosphate reductase
MTNQDSSQKIRVGVVGGTGYTGVELLRHLCLHPHVDIVAVTSRSEAGQPVSTLFPSLRGHLDLPFTNPDAKTLSECDVVFFATPNGVAMKMTPELWDNGVKIIDLAADFRLKDPKLWEKWYGMPHACPELLQHAVYGLPETQREQIRTARLIANPGCYPTAVQLGFLPLIQAGLIQPEHLIADTKSGVSGAGRQAHTGTLLCESSESLKAYAVMGHRHLPEIQQQLSMATTDPVHLTFVPHLTPMIRGIHATLYATLRHSPAADLQTLYQTTYQNEPFVDVLPAGEHPSTSSVKGTNMCRLSVHIPEGGNTVVILSVIDNLIKGAAGQAIHNMNLMFNLKETSGLTQIAHYP